MTAVASGAADDPDPIHVNIDPRERARRRNEAIELLWLEQYPRLAGWCAMVMGNPDKGREVADESFKRLIEKWFGVRDPKGFVYVTATNCMRDEWRRGQRDLRLMERLQPFTPVQTEPADGSVRDLVERLPERLRAPMLLFWWADLPVKEVAAALKLPEGTVKRQLKEGREALRLTFEVPE
jgi:RNA polymerase sigma-70 factor (ECF subfamily)